MILQIVFFCVFLIPLHPALQVAMLLFQVGDDSDLNLKKTHDII